MAMANRIFMTRDSARGKRDAGGRTGIHRCGSRWVLPVRTDEVDRVFARGNRYVDGCVAEIPLAERDLAVAARRPHAEASKNRRGVLEDVVFATFHLDWFVEEHIRRNDAQ